MRPSSMKCPVQLCKQFGIPMFLDTHRGLCHSCGVIVRSYGEPVVDKINNPLYCQSCFRNNRKLNGAVHKDWDDWKYHKKCWLEIKEDSDS